MAFSQSAENVVLSLPDFTVLLNNAIAQLQPSVAGRLPTPLGTQLGEDIQTAMGESLLRGLQAARRVRGYVWLALLTGAICLAGSVGLWRRTADAPCSSPASPSPRPPSCSSRCRACSAPSSRLASTTPHSSSPPGACGWRSPRASKCGRLCWPGWDWCWPPRRSSLASHLELEHALGRAWAWLRRPTRQPCPRVSPASRSSWARAPPRSCGPWRRVRLLVMVVGGALVFEGLRSLFALIAAAARRGRRACARGAGRNAAEGARAHPALRYALVAGLVVAALAVGIAWFIGGGAAPPPGGVRRSLQRLKRRCAIGGSTPSRSPAPTTRCRRPIMPAGCSPTRRRGWPRSYGTASARCSSTCTMASRSPGA